MKNAVFTLLFFSLFAYTTQAQAPQAFKYQAVVRDAAGQVLANQDVGLQIRLSPADTSQTLYAETHSATTTALGLVNLNVGHGAVFSGQFDLIDWEQPVYIHIGLDINGGAAYQEMGFSELLSVPYALYAANAAGGRGLPTDAQTGDIAYYNGTVWQRLPAGATGTLLTMGADGLPVWKEIPAPLNSPLKVTMTNGEVIYVSPVDQISFPPGVEWGGFGTNITALTNMPNSTIANMDLSGETNTAAIVAQLGNNGGAAYAARVCADLEAYGFDDWYLPAAGELNEIYRNLGPNGSGQIATGFYWSSSEATSMHAWNQDFSDGNQFGYGKSGFTQCRCVRRY